MGAHACHCPPYLASSSSARNAGPALPRWSEPSIPHRAARSASRSASVSASGRRHGRAAASSRGWWAERLGSDRSAHCTFTKTATRATCSAGRVSLAYGARSGTSRIPRWSGLPGQRRVAHPPARNWYTGSKNSRRYGQWPGGRCVSLAGSRSSSGRSGERQEDGRIIISSGVLPCAVSGDYSSKAPRLSSGSGSNSAEPERDGLPRAPHPCVTSFDRQGHTALFRVIPIRPAEGCGSLPPDLTAISVWQSACGRHD